MRQAENLLEKRYKVTLSSLKEKETILGVCMDVKRKKRAFSEYQGVKYEEEAIRVGKCIFGRVLFGGQCVCG